MADWQAVGLSIAALAGAGCVLVALLLGMMAWYWWRERKRGGGDAWWTG